MRILMIVIIMLLGRVASAETLLMLTSSGYYVCDVTDGVPGNWFPLEEWPGFERVIKSDGGTTVPPSDSIAVQVDKWSDDVDDAATRPRWAAVWNKVIADVESGKIAFTEAEEFIDVAQVRIIEELDAAYRAAWTVWNAKVSDLIDDEKRQRRYAVTTLVSIHKGLVGF